jgi:pimeloyl-ACP methyl ester carboxylesterase
VRQEPPELVDPRWILKALAVVIGVAVVCAYATLCLLFYQGQWQIVLHPSRTVTATPGSLGLAASELHFDVDATGAPQLDGWWIPADAPSNTTATALLLHGADGDMSDALPQALVLHKAGLNVLVFDYRGYGRSTGRHPDENTMRTDAASALDFVIGTQHVAPQHIVLFGQGVGASLAAALAAQHPEIPALILEAPDGDLLDRAAGDPHSSLIPARLLFHENFALAGPLATLRTPKLLLKVGTPLPAMLNGAAGPKQVVQLPSANDPAEEAAIQSFVAQNVAR